MARYEASPFGRIRGKVGEAIGEYWKGIKYMKGYTTPTDRKSQKQLNIRWLWFIVGSMYGLYHSQLKDNPRSGMQNLPLLELDYQDYLRACIRQAQNTVTKISSLKFNRSEIDFSKSYLSGEHFAQDQGRTPYACLRFTDSMNDSEYNFTDRDFKGTLILFDVANKKTWCYAINDGLNPYDEAGSGTFRDYYGTPYTVEPNNYTFAFLLFDITGTKKSGGQRVRKWSYAFHEYGEITADYY